MAKANQPVTMRVRVGDSEIEVTGPEGFVERKIKEFLERPVEIPTRGPVPVRSQPSSLGADATKKMSAAQFLKKASPRTDVDTVLAAGYFLERSKKQQNFTSTEIRDLIQEAKRKPPTNTNDSINANIKKGLMMPAGDREGRKAFVLTSDGEEAVEESLTES